MSPHIAHWIWNLSIGGDAKNACALAIAQKSWAKVSVLVKSSDPGVRTNELSQQSIPVVPGIYSGEELKSWLDKDKPSLMIIHRSGRHDQLET